MCDGCTRTPRDIHQYRPRISGPLLDRIDIHSEVPAVNYRELADRAEGESSAVIAARVERACEVRLERFHERFHPRAAPGRGDPVPESGPEDGVGGVLPSAWKAREIPCLCPDIII